MVDNVYNPNILSLESPLFCRISYEYCNSYIIRCQVVYWEKIVYNTNMLKDLGKKLKKLRKEQDLSQKELAKELGFTLNQISDWEIGRSMPSVEQLMKIAMLFDISLDKLVGM